MFPRCFTGHDWCRSYVLPDWVVTAIPRTGSVGMLGAHNAARGLLVEICRHAGAIPVALVYGETDLPDGAIVVGVTANAYHPDRTTVRVTTATRSLRHPPDRGTGNSRSTACTRSSETGRGRRPRQCRATWSPA
ncbi:hypothetical protein I4I84_14720 [Pseudonocardia sp. KRD-182]|uniref:hypothetical protein n=1 Tax=Pseudonocardia oceani TaxID=2792013 RepID=UPI001C49FABD|nr:hypothetical protein [Pseudonocardia oceani]MBW0109976.1 hypothetical protein [Pseudonocardia oceani]